MSILNRTVQVRPDGTWVLPNVPANMGQVRARATCIEQGVTRSGQSAFFTLPANGAVDVPPIQLGVVEPIPTLLTLTAPTTTLPALGATAQLTVMATFPDGSSRNVTAGASGTNYTGSNPAVATVSPDGLVTAVASGTVVLSALHDGALGLLRLQVVASGDTDGDGLPDDLELANGLNPNDPVDALEDFDRDGLTNRQELLDFGTDLRRADTDGDGIRDGEEVAPGADGFITSPLLPDTDGDGLRDALEIATGSDPTDPQSFNLARALAALEVTPPVFLLTLNTILGEASRQLRVTGLLTDGATLDLTSAARWGTTYASSDLTICNFGAPAGRVFAGRDGTCTLTVTNSGFTAQVLATIRTFAPTALSFLPIPGFANNVAVQGDVAYVAAGATGLQVVDVANRRIPLLVGAADTPGNANDVTVVGPLAYLADGPAGVQIFDVSNPFAPVQVGALDTPGIAQDVVVKGGLAFVADGAAGLQILDVTTPAAPRLLGTLDTPGVAKGVDVDLTRRLAVVADGAAGLRVVDLTTLSAPHLLGSVATGHARDVVLAPDGMFAFVADSASSLTVVDLTTPTAPVVRAVTPRDTGGLLFDVALAGRFAFGADIFFVNGVPIVEVSNPATPLPRAILDFRSFRDDDGTGLAVDQRFVYLTASRGIVENGATGDTRLYIGQYLQIEDPAGLPPTVRLTAPAAGATVVENQPVTLRAEATDDIAVAAVDFLVDGGVVFTDTVAPYEFTATVPVGPPQLTLGARAVDFGENVGVAQPVLVSVIPDPPPTVTITAPVEGATVMEGATLTVTVEASDNGEVRTVQFAVNGAPLPPLTTPPYVRHLTVPVGFPSLTLTATATDNLGKTTTATRILAVLPDPPPIVTLTDPAEGVTPIEGEEIILGAVATDNRFVQSVRFTVNGVSVFVDTRPPFVAAFTVPVGVGSLLIEAIATDNLGKTATATRTLLVLPDPPPTVALTAPAAGATLMEGAIIRLSARVSDNLPGVTVVFRVDGVSQPPVTNPPYRIFFPVPSGVTGLTIEAIATDSVGKTAADTVAVHVIADPKTTVVGRVVHRDGNPAVGVTVACLEVSVVTGGDGTFTIPGFPTSRGRVRCRATAATPEGQRLAGLVAGVPPVGGGTTEVGTIVLQPLEVRFQERRVSPDGLFPAAVAVEDLNRDGIPDLVTANFDSSDVSVLLGAGDGTFALPQLFPAGLGPAAIAVADLNGDAVPDLVTANFDANEVTVLLGTGTGAFAAPQAFSVGLGPLAVAVADLNRDALPDLITANELSGDVTVLLGAGPGTFAPGQAFPAEGQVLAVAVGDFNQDGLSDLVITHSLFAPSGEGPAALFFGGLSILRGNGDGTFAPPEIIPAEEGGQPARLAVADLNRDGFLDIAGADPVGNSVLVLLGVGDGTFEPERFFFVGWNPAAIAVADLNHDGAPDLVTANSASADISVLLGVGDGTFEPEERFGVGEVPLAVIAADLNGDTLLDLVTANGVSGDLSVLLHQ